VTAMKTSTVNCEKESKQIKVSSIIQSI
jgi:hypothetical protein